MTLRMRGKKPKTKKEREDEGQLRALEKIFERRGIAVRREKLARGSAYRVKSGNCIYSGQQHLFIDRRLPLEQQVTVLVDYLCELQPPLPEEELIGLSPATKTLLAGRTPSVDVALGGSVEATSGASAEA